PNIHMGKEVTLRVILEVSSVTSRVNIGGIDQPVIGQRRVEHQIRLKEGEVNLIGGILEEQDVRSLQGWPFLSQIPILRYLFSQEHTEHTENEIVFALIPHVVRGNDLTSLNMRALDVGTANAINLRQMGLPNGNGTPNGTAPANGVQRQPGQQPAMPPGVPPQGQPAPPQQNPAPQIPAPQGQLPQTPPPQPQTPGGAAQPAQAAGSLGIGGAIFSFDPPQAAQPAGSTFALNVSLSNAQNIHSVPLTVNYDPKLLQLVNVSNGGFLGKDGQPVALVHREDPAGTLQLTASRPPGSGGITGQGSVFTLTFVAKSSGQTTVSITRAGARDAAMQAIVATGSQAMVTVK
ncbi:MAG: cohesin domain-containing protein, partial [Candidatus Korobacteraceae bacterium]